MGRERIGIVGFERHHYGSHSKNPVLTSILRGRRATADIRQRYLEHQYHQTEESSVKFQHRRAFSAADVDRKPLTNTSRREVSSARNRNRTQTSSENPLRATRDGIVEFDALTRTFVPLPKLHGQRPGSGKYLRKSISEWEKEVTKVVPKRPSYSMSAKIVNRGKSQARESGMPRWSNPSLFYRVDRQKCKGKEYIIYPDWPSERLMQFQNWPKHRRQSVQLAWG